MAGRMPVDVGELVQQLGISPPFRLLDVVRGWLVGTKSVEAVNLLLVDYAEELLSPFGGHQGAPLGRERVDEGEAGAAYRTQATRVGRVQLGWRACVPVSVGAERLGVLDVQLAAEPGPVLIDVLGRAAVALAFALVAARRSTDEVELARRGRSLSLPAEMQWDLLPALAFETAEYAVAGTVEPAYEVGGDLFDYAVQAEALTVSVTDAMGHGLQAAVLAGLATAALRNARRRPAGLLAQANDANRALHQQFGGERFVTGQLLRLDVPAGSGAVVNAGHPLPRRMRGDRIEPVRLDADLPLGVDDEATYRVQRFTLEQGDRLVLLSDGVLEAAPEGGAAYGAARLDAVLRAHRKLPSYELVRRVVREVIAHRDGELADDVTIVCLDWRGPAS